MILSGATGEMDRILDRNMPPFFLHPTDLFPNSITPHGNMPSFYHILKKYVSILSNVTKKEPILSHLKELFPLYITSYINMPHWSYLTELHLHFVTSHRNMPLYNSLAPAPAPAPTRCYVPILCLNFPFSSPCAPAPFLLFQSIMQISAWLLQLISSPVLEHYADFGMALTIDIFPCSRALCRFRHGSYT